MQPFVGVTAAKLGRQVSIRNPNLRLELHQALHPRPVRNERGEDRGEGKQQRQTSSPQPSPPSDGREEEIQELDAALFFGRCGECVRSGFRSLVFGPVSIFLSHPMKKSLDLGTRWHTRLRTRPCH
jgi:hypothetical protein